jgi:hypothetical protein
MNSVVKLNEEKLKIICEKNYVSQLFLFGSGAKGQDKIESDLDFAVLFLDKLSPLEHGVAFFELKNSLENLFSKEIDLISYRMVKNPVFKAELEKTKIQLYAA